MKQENLSHQIQNEHQTSWGLHVRKHPLNEKFKIDNCFVAWENSYTAGGEITVDVFGDVGEKYFYTTWTYIGKKIIKSNTTYFENKIELKNWLKTVRDTDFKNKENLINVARFLYF